MAFVQTDLEIEAEVAVAGVSAEVAAGVNNAAVTVAKLKGRKIWR